MRGLRAGLASHAALASLLAALAACGANDAPAGTSGAAITSGADDDADPAVVAIVDEVDRVVCTGTLIAPHVVLTAAHCGVGESSYLAFRVVFGASVSAGTHVPIMAALAHPQFDGATFANDLALLAIGDGATVTPIPRLAPAAASALPSATVRVVGFGETAPDAPASMGRKRSGTSTVTSVAATTFTVAPGPSLQCFGDSGGPAFVTVAGAEVLAGVISHGDAQCLSDDTETRVDPFADFVQPFVDRAAPGTIAAGNPCWYEGHCAAAACASAPDDPRIRYCAPACANDAACPSGMRCTSSPTGARCAYPTPTKGALGAACTTDGDCLDGECLATSSGQVCSRRCTPVEGSCPTGFACTHTSGIDFECLAVAPPAAAPKGGCSASPGASSGAPLVALLALSVFARRRRRVT